MNIALYPGAFKPPTKGHLGVVKQVLSGKYNTAKVDRETGKYEKATENPKMDQVWVIVGDMVKGGAKQKGSDPEVAVGQDEAIAVWQEYLKANGLEGKVKLYRAGEVREDVLSEDVGYLMEGPNPVRDTYGLLKDKYVRGEYEGIDFFPIVGYRPDNAEAIKDLQRMDAASKKYGEHGLQILVVLDEPTPGEESVSATKLRAALAAKDKSKIEKYAAASADALLKHFTKQDALDNAIAEAMMKAVHDMLNADTPPTEALKEAAVKFKEEVKESNRDMPSPEVEDIAPPPSEFTNKLEYFKEYFQNLTNFPVTVDKYQNIVIQTGQRLPMNEVADLNEVTSQELDFTPFLSSILEFMLDKKMRITPIPNIEIKMDVDAATDIFGPTAYYDPTNATVCLYVLGRHPKDVLRSFCHEMIHHMQNMEGRLPAFSTNNTQEDSVLNEIEKEAHALGSMTFREWEDTVKNNFDVVKEEVMAEGKYDTITNQLSRIAFEAFKDAYERGDKRAEFEFRVGDPDHDEVDIESTQFEFDFMGVVNFTDDTYKVDGGANAGIDDDGEEIQPMINVNFQIPKDVDWQTVSMDLKDVVRHELEHLTQDGENIRSGKYIPDDQDLRAMIDAGLLDKDTYFTLPKEVDAMIQGLYYKAKKSKQPFADVVNDYLNKAMISLDNKEKVLTLWRKRLPALGIKQKL